MLQLLEIMLQKEIQPCRHPLRGTRTSPKRRTREDFPRHQWRYPYKATSIVGAIGKLWWAPIMGFASPHDASHVRTDKRTNKHVALAHVETASDSMSPKCMYRVKPI